MLSAPAINAQRVQVNDKLTQTADLRVVAQRSFMTGGRSVWAYGRVRGSKRNLCRRFGASFDAKTNGDPRNVAKGFCSHQGMQAIGHGGLKATNANYKKPDMVWGLCYQRQQQLSIEALPWPPQRLRAHQRLRRPAVTIVAVRGTDFAGLFVTEEINRDLSPTKS